MEALRDDLHLGLQGAQVSLLGIVLAATNVAAFILFGLDKLLAKLGARRVPESTLLASAVIGAAGACAGMLAFRHKTRKTRFRVLVPLLVVVEAIGLALWLRAT